MNFQKALEMAADVAQGQGVHYATRDLLAATRTLVSATGEHDMNTNPTTYAAYRTLAVYAATR